jgi:hypothetical protein
MLLSAAKAESVSRPHELVSLLLKRAATALDQGLAVHVDAQPLAATKWRITQSSDIDQGTWRCAQPVDRILPLW